MTFCLFLNFFPVYSLLVKFPFLCVLVGVWVSRVAWGTKPKLSCVENQAYNLHSRHCLNSSAVMWKKNPVIERWKSCVAPPPAVFSESSHRCGHCFLGGNSACWKCWLLTSPPGMKPRFCVLCCLVSVIKQARQRRAEEPEQPKRQGAKITAASSSRNVV